MAPLGTVLSPSEARPRWAIYPIRPTISASDKPPLGGNLNRTFKATLKHAGLPAIRFHDLRHTCHAPTAARRQPEICPGASRPRRYKPYPECLLARAPRHGRRRRRSYGRRHRRWIASASLVSEWCQKSPGTEPGLFCFLPVCREIVSAPGRIRTSDSRFRKPLLYPLSYRRKNVSSLSHEPGAYHAPTRCRWPSAPASRLRR